MKTILITITLFVLGCDSSLPQQGTITLSSGKAFKIVGVSKVTSDEYPPTIIIQYETDLIVENTPELRNQVQEIWQVVKKDVESEHYNRAIISALNHKKILLYESNKYWNYVFQKVDSADWSLSPY